MFRIEMLPARHGDCILIEYGDEDRIRRILIDGGTRASFDDIDARLAKIDSQVELELLVVSHVDEDHIGGTLRQLVEKPGRLKPKDVWFNAYKHLASPDKLGPPQGEALSTRIMELTWPWNRAFNGGSVVVPEDGELKPITLEGGARITLLSPTWKKLGELLPVWKAECERAGIIPGKGAKSADVLGKHPPPKSLDVPALLKASPKRDTSKPNGSSIAFLFEYDGKRAILGADAHPEVLVATLKRLKSEPVEVDAFKVCHHGSRNNASAALVDQLRCKRFLVSTNGETFGHPDPEGIAHFVAAEGKKSLHFNYQTDYSHPWMKESLRGKYAYTVEFPEVDGALAVEL